MVKVNTPSHFNLKSTVKKKGGLFIVGLQYNAHLCHEPNKDLNHVRSTRIKEKSDS